MSRQRVRFEIGDILEVDGKSFLLTTMIANTGRPARLIFAPIQDEDDEVPADILAAVEKYLHGDDSSTRIVARRSATLNQVRDILDREGLDSVTAEAVIASVIESGIRFRQKG